MTSTRLSLQQQLQRQSLQSPKRMQEPPMHATAKRQQLEKDRMIRVFDAKARTIGVDKDALDVQKEEKERLALVNKQRDYFLDAQLNATDQHAVYLAQQVQDQNYAIAKDTNLYRDRFQKANSAREWDLNNPAHLREDLPARIGDDDPRCGPSSMQKFYGEDLDARDRKKRQQELQKQWLDQQMEEKNMIDWLEKSRSHQLQDRNEELNFRSKNINDLIKAQKTTETKATAEFNKALAAQKGREKMKQRKQDTLDNFEEIRNWLDSDLLTENPMSTLNVNDPSRFKQYHMKGIPPEAKQAVLNEQACQRDDLRKRREQEAIDDAVHALALNHLASQSLAREAELEEKKQAAVKLLCEDWEHQATVAATNRTRLNETYTNVISDEWWSKFNTTSR